MTERYKSLETTIREAARKAMQEKADKLRLTTKMLEDPKPVDNLTELMLEESVDEDYGKSEHDEKATAMGWSKNKYGKWAHPDFPGAAYTKSKHAVADTPDWRKENERKQKKEEVEVEEAKTGFEMSTKPYPRKFGTEHKPLFKTIFGKRKPNSEKKPAKTFPMPSKPFREEEEIDELSDTTLKSYKKKAAGDVKRSAFPYKNTVWDSTKHSPKAIKRNRGIETANSKLAKEDAEIEEAMPGQADPMQDKLKQQKAQVQKQKDQIRMQLAQQRAQKQEQAMKAKGEKSLEKIKEDELDEAKDKWAIASHHHTEKPGRAYIQSSIGHPYHQLKKIAKSMNSNGEGQRYTVVKHIEDMKEDELDEWGIFSKLKVRTFDRASKLQKLHAMRSQRYSATGDNIRAERHRMRAAEYKRLAYQAKDNPTKIMSPV